MKIKTAVKAVLIISLCICLSSCNVLDFFSVDTLIRAPKITGRYSQLQQAFENIAGPEAKTVSPVSGDYRSSYILTDIDSDGIDEALVFFKRTEGASVSLGLLRYEEQEWTAVGDIGSNSSGVYEVSFCDFDSDGCKEIAVIWNSNDSGETDNTMTVYSLTDKNGGMSEFSAIASISVYSYFIHNFCLGGENDVFYLTHDSSSGGTKLCAQLISFEKKGEIPNLISKINLTSEIETVEQMQCEDSDLGTRVFIDCKSKDGTYFTEIIDFNRTDNAFSVPDGAEKIYKSGKTSRQNAIYCTDIDDDGKIEIPVDIPFLNGETVENSKDENVSMIEWREFSDGRFIGKEKTFVNQEDGYSMCMNSFYGISYISYDSSSHTARWYKSEGYSISDKSSGTILFSVIFTGLSPEKTDEDDYLVVITEEGTAMNIKKSRITSLIEPLN